MEAAPRKYASLPDVDQNAPDIFETPELTEDTTLSGTQRSDSEASFSDENDGDGIGDGNKVSRVTRTHINQHRARARFLGSRVDATDADFSDRLARGNQDRAYIVSTSRRRRQLQQQHRQQRKEQDGATEGEGQAVMAADNGEGSTTEEEDNDTPEGLRHKLARLNREAAELRADMERLQAQSKDSASADDLVGDLEQDLSNLNSAILHGQSSAQARFAKKIDASLAFSPEKSKDTGNQAASQSSAALQTAGMSGGSAMYTISYAPNYDSARALSQAASFDRRLAGLEAALGIDRIPLPSQEDQSTSRGVGPGPAYPKPVLPTLDVLDRQLATLTSTTGASLDAVSKRVSQLTRDAERLSEARQHAKDAQEALMNRWAARHEDGGIINGANGDRERDLRPGKDATAVTAAAGLGLDDPEVVARINALHGALPTIEALAPVVPGLLDRLRSLRLIHQDAAAASRSLAEVERRQQQADEEMAQWRDTLAHVEAAIARSDTTTADNLQAVEGWVAELTQRVKDINL